MHWWDGMGWDILRRLDDAVNAEWYVLVGWGKMEWDEIVSAQW